MRYSIIDNISEELVMKAEDRSFNFLAAPGYYDIPFFQRSYVWGEENWTDLLNDLKSKSQHYFLGSIILKNEPTLAGSNPRFSIIDGQQRLTTLSILLRACYDHIVKNAHKYNYDEADVTTCQVQMESILFVSEGGIKKKLFVKINHSHLDKKAFESVINGELDKDDIWEKYVNPSDDESASSIIRAYAFFRDELEDISQDDIEHLWSLLTVDKIKFLVNINLDPSDNEQAIFDTVNSSGVRLSSADTIKNLLYQKYVELLRADDPATADERAIEEYKATWVDAFIPDETTNAYWETLRQYGRMKRSNIETFLHAFAVVEGFFNPAENVMSELHQEYRNKISAMSLDQLEVFLMKLHDYADVFMDYFSDEEDELEYSDYIGRVFNICNVLEVSTFYPYLLQQIYAWKKHDISEDDIKKNFFVIEKYVVLNAICKGSTKNYNNECRQMVDKRKTPSEVMESCEYISEGNFVDGLRRMTANKLPTLLLFWVELYQRAALNYDFKRLRYNYTLEHIMPQKWEKNWSDVPAYDKNREVVEDSDEIERVRSHAIYEIGNMTLLNSKLNTSISNGSFYDKINGKPGRKGIKDLADFRLTRDVIENNNEWNELKIYDRTVEIEKRIREIWDASELPKVVAVKTKNENVGRKKIRFEFWSKALPLIQKMNQYESFGNVNPSTSNMVSGYFGIGGFSVTCSANYDKARVDFFLSKSDKAQNEKAFDILSENKDAIEAALGVHLTWERADEYKASWISHTLPGVSIADVNDWDKMAEFLGEWSCKLRKTMIPYLIEAFPQDTSGKSSEEISRLLSIAGILKEWTINAPMVIERPDKCNRTYTRFLTKNMSRLLPDIVNAPSGWNTDNHYFYEIVNRTGKTVDIKLSISSRNMTADQLEICKSISKIVDSKPAKEDWQWWVVFKTEKVAIPDDLDKTTIFDGLNEAYKSIEAFEMSLGSRLQMSL